MPTTLADLLALQCGVLSRAQAREAGRGDADIRRMVRRREWAVVFPGVYVDHTGPLLWQQRAWAAVLAVWPAALSHASAMRAMDGPGRRDRDDRGPIHVAVDRDRSVVAPRGVVVHRLGAFDAKVTWNASPPRLRVDEAVLDLAAEARDEYDAVAVLADAVQSRRTTASRIGSALAQRTRIARRDFLTGVLADIEEGTCSALEHAYLTRVERPHGLPRPRRQWAPAGQGVLRDIDYEEFGVVLELDGRLFHDHARAWDADLERDLDARILDARATVRLGWGQALRRPCSTAAKVASLLRQRGWPGPARRCPSCPQHDGGGSQSAGDWDPPLSV